MTTEQSNLTTDQPAGGVDRKSEPADPTSDPAPEAPAGADEAGTTATTGQDEAGTTATTGQDGTEPTADRELRGDPPKDSSDPATGKERAASTDGEESEADPWAAFGPAPEVVPNRWQRMMRAVGRTLIHEWSLAGFAALALAVLMTWPALRYPRHTIAHDIGDPTLQAWQMAWSGHILLTDPTRLWHANAFYPESWSFAFSDTLLGYAPIGMLGSGPVDAVLRYNIMFVLVHALAALGAYALVRQLGAGRTGAAVAGAAYAYAPWLLAQAGHLHVLSNGGIPLALAMLARGHGWSLRHGYRPDRRRSGWALAGWLVATWQVSLGFGIGLVFAYMLGLTAVVVVVGWLLRRVLRRARRPFGWRLIMADLTGVVIFCAVGVLLAIPYFRVVWDHPEARRTADQLNVYSPPWQGFFTAPAESRIWGTLHEPVRETLPWDPETALLPGFVLYALAVAGLFLSIWTLRQRLLLLAGVLITGILAMGTRFFDGTYTYLPIFEHVPGWDGLRTPGRLMLWTTLLLGVLAAGAVGAYAERAQRIAAAVRVPPRPGPLVRLVTLLPLLLVLMEGLNVTPHPIVPQQPAALADVEGPVLVLPSSQEDDQHAMLWSTSGFPDLVNGGSGFTPRRLEQVRLITVTFPDQASIDHLRSLGVKTVVLLRDRVAGTPWQTTVDLPVDSFGIHREDVGNAVVYRLS